MEVNVTLSTNKDYADDLRKRMAKADPPISQNELAGELKPPRSPTQVSRWFTKNPARRVVPEMKTVLEIEQAMKRLEARRARRHGSADHE